MKGKSNEERTLYITHNGQTKTLREWESITGIKWRTLWARLSKGWPGEEVFTNKDFRSIRKKSLRKDSHMITYQEKTKPLFLWAKELGIHPTTIAYRLRSGWSVRKTFQTPATHTSYNGLSVQFPSEHWAWTSMKKRCCNKSHASWDNYGGRGIRVCKEWLYDFPQFFADMGPKPSSQHSLDRIDNNGDYTPENCHWAVPRHQCRNKRTNRVISFQGESLCLAEWSERTGLSWSVINGRLRRGWSVQETLTIQATLKKPHVRPAAGRLHRTN